MEDADIYKTQDQFIADWLDILSRINNGKQRARRRGTDEDLEISQSEADDILIKSYNGLWSMKLAKHALFTINQKIKAQSDGDKNNPLSLSGLYRIRLPKGRHLIINFRLINGESGSGFSLKKKVQAKKCPAARGSFG